MDLRKKLLQHKPKVTEIEILGEKYYVRALSVGDVNRGLFGQHKLLCDIAKAQGIELDYDDPDELGKQLGKVYDPYRLARNLAIRLCDKDGNLLFDFENEDLTDIFSLHPIDYDEMKGPYYFVLTLQTHDYSLWKRYRIEADLNSDNSLSYYNVMAQHTIWE